MKSLVLVNQLELPDIQNSPSLPANAVVPPLALPNPRSKLTSFQRGCHSHKTTALSEPGAVEQFAKRVNMIVHTDSKAGRSIATRFGAGKKSKHIELRYLYIQDLVRSGVLAVKKIHTKLNPADV